MNTSAEIHSAGRDPGSDRVRVVAWFDGGRALAFEEATQWDGRDHVSVAAGPGIHERLYRTAAGRWVLQRWSDLPEGRDSYQYVTEDEARRWLDHCGYEKTVEGFATKRLEQERHDTHAPLGPDVHARLDLDLLARIDLDAAVHGETRAAAIRRLLAEALEGRERRGGRRRA